MVEPESSAWTDLFSDGAERFGASERKQYLDELTSRVADGMSEGELGWTASAQEVHAGTEAVLAKRIASAARRGGLDPYARPQDFTRDCHKGLVAMAFERAGVRLDFTTHEILRRWGREFGVANFSHNVPRPPRALRCWATAELERPDDARLLIRRRRAPEYQGQVIPNDSPAPTSKPSANAEAGGSYPSTR